MAANRQFKVATVNRYNIGDPADEDVLRYCEAIGIGFIPWSPIGGGVLLGCVGEKVAAKNGSEPRQIALAWLLRRSSAMLPIPGTSRVPHLEANVASASVDLSDKDYLLLD